MILFLHHVGPFLVQLCLKIIIMISRICEKEPRLSRPADCRYDVQPSLMRFALIHSDKIM